MTNTDRPNEIRVAIAGLGNCGSSLLEGITYYQQHPYIDDGLLFPILAGYNVRDIKIVVAFDISAAKVNKFAREAICQPPNNNVHFADTRVDSDARVYRGPTLDGDPAHLAKFVAESDEPVVDVPSVLRDHKVDVLVNLLPTGSIEATEFYATSASEACCAFVNCIPTPIAQRKDFQDKFIQKGLPLLGDDIKSQIGTTILHRTLLRMLKIRGAKLVKTSQVNIGGNTDFANFVYRAETKLVSKRKSLASLVGDAQFHVGHHYDPTKGPLKNAYIEIDTRVFGNSPVRISVKLESDDKPNSAGSIVDLIRLAKGAFDKGMAGPVLEACAFYMKSPPVEMDELNSLELIRQAWTQGG